MCWIKSLAVTPVEMRVDVQVMRLCESRGVTIRVATEKLIAEEAPESYKDVSQVQCPRIQSMT